MELLKMINERQEVLLALAAGSALMGLMLLERKNPAVRRITRGLLLFFLTVVAILVYVPPVIGLLLK